MDRSTEKRILAHGIAKQIHEFAKADWEIDEILEMVENVFQYGRRRGKSDIPEEPIDMFGNKIKMPKEESQGIQND